jgi:aminoglycoside 6'-N-acetyltransferase
VLGSDARSRIVHPYSFRRMTRADLAMIRRWLDAPAVREWWIDADGKPAAPIEADDLAAPAVAMWIVSFDDRPFAFMQDYDPHAWAGHHFAHLPPRSRGIDQFIGEPDMIARGHGSAFIRARVDTLLADGVPAVGTDPHPDNARAIRAYEKAGFLATEVRSTAWGRCLLMERHVSRR